MNGNIVLRRFGRILFAAAALLMVLDSAASAAAPEAGGGGDEGDAQNRPNIVFILVDDLAYDALGYMNEGRYPFVKTPHIDRLAAHGARFANAFVTTSLCSPSRASFLTGMYAHRHGVRTNEGMGIDPSTPTFPKVLQDHGYRTAYVGKWHMTPTDRPRPGFDYWLSFKGQGQYRDPTFNENGRRFQAEGYMTDLLTEYAMQWLKKQGEQPFCLYLSHKAVHAPRVPAKRHRDLYEDVKMTPPANWSVDLSDNPRWMRRQIQYGISLRNFLRSKGKPVLERIPPRQWNPHSRKRIRYFQTLMAVDDSVGRIIQTLREIGELSNTFVVFTSDNGFFLGSHRRGDKRLAYEESIRIPLIIRYPELAEPGSVVEAMALNIDIAPTLLDLAGAPIPDPMQGRSLLPLLRGPAPENWRDAFFYEYFRELWIAGIPTILAVRTHRWKYITTPYLPKSVDQLYDLKNDPNELHNLAQNPDYADQLAKMRRLMEKLKDKTDYVPWAVARRKTIPDQLVVKYATGQTAPGILTDASEHSYDARLRRGAKVIATQYGPALSLSGNAVAVFNTTVFKMDPMRKPLTVGAWVKPKAEDGVIAAIGGHVRGFSLLVKNRVPRFTIKVARVRFTAKGDQKLPMGRWTHVVGVLTPAGHVELYINGNRVDRTEGFLIDRRPAQSFNIGADLHTQVGNYKKPLYWQGLLRDIRLYWGVIESEKLRKWASRSP